MRPAAQAVITLGMIAAQAAASAPGSATPSLDALHMAESNRMFALELFNAVRDDGNLFLSPYSISAALGMTYAGAGGPTAEEMAKVLHFDLPPERLHKAFAELMQQDTTAAGEDVEIAVANALWADRALTFRPEYVELTRRFYDAGVRTLDFAGEAEAARSTINDWVAGHTRKRIEELLKPGDIDSGTAAVLTNAIYFKGLWWRQFDETATDVMPFQLGGSVTVDTEMMMQRGPFRVHAAPHARVLCLPYRGEKMSFVVILPNEVDGLAKLAAELKPAEVEGWITQARRSEFDVYLPRFQLKSRLQLKEPLQRMGMRAAFGAADFSAMAERDALVISKVVHEAFVEVTEEGTEAAAATGVVMTRTALTPVFRADHPFLFIIRNDLTGSWLFLGQLTRPEAAEADGE